MAPGAPLLWTAGVWLAASVAVSFRPAWLEWWLLAAAVIAAVAAVDALVLRRIRTPAVRRIAPRELALNGRAEVRVELVHAAGAPVRLDVHDSPGEGLAAEGLPVSMLLAPGATRVLRYGLRATRRGDARFGPLHLRIESPLRLWRSLRRVEQGAELRVVPDLGAIVRTAPLAGPRLHVMPGQHRARRRGAGLEFHQLRDYRDGDTLRQIDWNATARVKRLIAREYEEERDQQIVFWLDTGHTMRTRDGHCSHFDAALNALLLMGWVALRHGDSVGLQAIGAANMRWLPPAKGLPQLHRMIDATYDLDAGTAATDLHAAAAEFLIRQRRRALVVILSNLPLDDQPEAASLLRRVAQRHLVLFANLRESALDDSLRDPVTDHNAALRQAAVLDFLAERRLRMERLRAAGIVCLDTSARELGGGLVGEYLAIKRAGRL
ncbi:MAG: DUF58 domain-containing protein [Chromatiales bacterium]|nr:DUF58 domain-containing protein [Chromatiales bacterium]